MEVLIFSSAHQPHDHLLQCIFVTLLNSQLTIIANQGGNSECSAFCFQTTVHLDMKEALVFEE